MFGLLISGENDQGIDDRMISKAIVNQMANVLNFSLSIFFRLAFDDPMVSTVMAITIMVMCSIPKNRICRSCTAVLKLCKK